MRKFVAESDTSLTQDDDMLRWKVGGKSELRHMNIRNTMKKNPDIPVRTARERTPDRERLVVWQKRPERKASVFFPKYGLYKHYDIGVELMAKSYDKLLIPDNSIIYCDPPYRGKKKYNIDSIFNHDRFYDWCVKMSQKGHKVFVSENDMSLPFREVWSMPLKNRLALNTTINTTERLYSNLTWMKKDSNLTL